MLLTKHTETCKLFLSEQEEEGEVQRDGFRVAHIIDAKRTGATCNPVDGDG